MSDRHQPGTLIGIVRNPHKLPELSLIEGNQQVLIKSD